MRFHFLLLFAYTAIHSLAAPTTSLDASESASPTVELDNATVVGVADGFTNSFLGIPYAQPPVGDLRFNLPKPVIPYSGTVNATVFGNLCYNFLNPFSQTASWLTPEMVAYLGIFSQLVARPYAEDCLNLNVIAPADVKPDQKLPVVAYFFFGAFIFGGSSDIDGRVLVKQSVEIGEPVIFVSMNHRLGPFGFLPGQEVKDAGVGNLGLQDQRESLRWIQKYISQFGGDPERVTLVGLSSGGVSAALHTVINGGNSEGLFHGVWAESGAIQPAGWINDTVPQATYDNFVKAIGCSGSADTLACARTAPVDVVTRAGLQGSWTPHADGSFITDAPQKLLANGQFTKVPVVAGNAEDEGTLLSVGIPPIANDTEFEQIIKASYYPDISDADMKSLLELYPDVPALGAPYGTGDKYQFQAMWKRVASLIGDVGVDAVRRAFVQNFAKRGVDAWAYVYRRNYVPGFGSTHGSELSNIYGGGDMGAQLIHFANTLNPSSSWPKYDLLGRASLEFYGNITNLTGVIVDNYREAGIQLAMKLNAEMSWPA
ncbi:alpha/beta-hydrolase [Dichomitus squalens]|uniref:Carboxylic ester hydrolase n=1 Tax=Dichomitus squalens TaxID=114155 RepID=A0A4Q9MV56_9APHY|nr:alpha/beta-hydrolase [Dichomitus squalens]TBU42418.1 alpha/beta-hydrolase [Dichomitus squalens]TBU61395.1 alpha/beta-hydrolase [Dichomitus squalens]